MQRHTYTVRVTPDYDCHTDPQEYEDGTNYLVSTMRRYLSANKDKAGHDTPEGCHRFTLYAYVHGSISLSLSPFSCPWDSGVAGYVVAPDKDRAQALVNIYNHALTGTNYRFEVVDETGEVVDTCTGYWSEDEAWEAGNVVAVTLTRQAQSLNPLPDYAVARLTY